MVTVLWQPENLIRRMRLGEFVELADVRETGSPTSTLSTSASSLHPRSSSREMDAFTYTVTSKTEETVLPPINEDSGSGSSGSCVVCKEDTELPPLNEDSGSGSSGSCTIA
ncbi:hypothetical protein B0H10DRAFT_2218069 [Mycena sp. CBHHK59/15]|nr:hypothetical protein B0H10DRAFT_2218069 [Mycena sp. CBHHK59/15]